MTIKNFSDLGLADPVQRALTSRNHTAPTPIQAGAIPHLLDGRDLLGIAQTGTGKTAAFTLPLLDRLHRTLPKGGRNPRALILAPTRELAIQIGDEIHAYAKFLQLRRAVIFGGVSQVPQVRNLQRGVDIVVATPGRLLDLLNQGRIKLNAVEVLVLDEADRMLDMGFVHDVRKVIAAVPAERQSLLFSATMPREIGRLSGEILSDPVRIEVAPQATPIERIAQSVYHVRAKQKFSLLADVLGDPALARVIVFTRTKHRANKVAAHLNGCGIAADAIHGNKSQAARQRALQQFRDGQVRVLVATDIAARGIDVDGVTHVVNFELPNEPESYVHRIGRTARAGAEGAALSFCDPAERAYLADIEKLIRTRLRVVESWPAVDTHDGSDEPAAAKPAAPANKPKKHRGRPWHKRKRAGGAPAAANSQGTPRRRRRRAA